MEISSRTIFAVLKTLRLKKMSSNRCFLQTSFVVTEATVETLAGLGRRPPHIKCADEAAISEHGQKKKLEILCTQEYDRKLFNN